MTNRFKDSQGRWRTQSLFYEINYNDDALFTMQRESRTLPNGTVLLSFPAAYIEISDPTEYRVATEILGGWEHWQALNRSQWFSEFIKPLRDELEVKLLSESILQTYLIMTKSDKSALPAAKLIMEGGYKPKRGRGRPSKAEVEAETKKMAEVERRVAEDARRLGLTVVHSEE